MSDTIHQALISHVGMNHLDLRPATPHLKYRVLVYTYLITDYFTPEKLGYIVWYVWLFPLCPPSLTLS